MRSRMLLAVVTVLMLLAFTANGEFYAGIRFPGAQNYFSDVTGLQDSGDFSRREIIIGYGDRIQGEITLGFGTLSGEVETSDGEKNAFSGDVELHDFSFGVAGYYPVMQREWYRIDAGLRLSFMSCNDERDVPVGRQESVYSLGCSGMTIGPTIRGRWMITDYIALGPEATLKYKTLSCDEQWTHEGDVIEDKESSFGAWGLDYAVRLEFMFY